jgi:hypothetical protein
MASVCVIYYMTDDEARTGYVEVLVIGTQAHIPGVIFIYRLVSICITYFMLRNKVEVTTDY